MLSNILRKRITPILCQGIILLLMLALTPYAITFSPYVGIYTDGVWFTSLDLDPLYWVRVSLIIFGLLGAILSLVFLTWEIVRGGWKGSDLILQLSMVLCSLSIGWRSFPYWVNGMFQAYSGNARLSDFDPKALMPEIWVGQIWTYVVLIIYLLAFIGIPIILLANIVLIIRRKTWKQGIGTAICLTIISIVFICSPDYWRWLAD